MRLLAYHCWMWLLLLSSSWCGFGQEQKPSGASEEYLIDIWDTDSGLPHSTVTSIAQTPDGYLWVGTLHGGLARFDGVRFVVFEPNNTPALSSREVQRLLVDPEGTLWIGFVGGTLFSYRQGTFNYERGEARTPGTWLERMVGATPDRTVMASHAGWLLYGTRQNGRTTWNTFQSPDGGSLSAFSETADGTIWYRTQGSKLAQFKNGQFLRVPAPPGLEGKFINALVKDHAGRIWVGTEREVAMWDGRQFVNMTPTNGPVAIPVLQMAFAGDGGLWVQTGKELRKCQGRSWVTEATPWDGKFGPSPRPLALYGEAQGGLWLVHYGSGLWRVDNHGEVTHIGEQQGLPSGLVECWFQDREGNVWAGLSGGGLVRLRQRTFHVVWPAEMLRDRAARSVCEDADGAMWFGTSGDSVLRWREGVCSTFTPPATGTRGRDGVVCPDGEGRLWVGTVQNGVWTLTNEQFQQPFPSEAVGTVARALYHDRQGRMWLGNEFGFYCWETNALRRVGPGYVLSIAEDESGTVWAGTANAQLRWVQNGQLRQVSFQSEAKDVRFWSLLPDKEGVIWIGTLGAGLLRYQDGKFTQYTTGMGLPNENVSQILADQRGQLWLGTRAGIARVNKEELEQFARGETKTIPFITYGKFDGLPSVECTGGCQPGCWRSRDGRLWFATAKGVVWTRAGEVPFNPLPPPVHIEEVRLDGQRVAESKWSLAAGAAPSQTGKDGRLSHGLEVGAGRHYFEFRFTALSFIAPDKVRFRWRLEGLESAWSEGKDKRTVSYSFVPPGNYLFHVQACNNDGVWNEAGDTLALTVLPYFWQRWWFRLLVAGAVLGALALGYSIRVARIRALARLRLRIARDLHDEVGANLGSISLLAQVQEKQPNSADATLIRNIATQTIDTLRDIIWFIDPKHDGLNDLVTRFRDTAQVMLQGIQYQFESSGELSSGSLPLEFSRNALPIFKEALHNIIKHSRATEVHILVRRQGHTFELQIRDNGQGFQSEGRFAGNGLKNMRRRAAEMGGKFEAESRPGQGAKLTLTAPLS